MHRILKFSISMLLIGAMLLATPLFVGAVVYDSAKDGIVSSYYHIDYEKGHILGIAPGTTASHLLSVCLPNDCVLSQEAPVTGASIASGDHTLTVIVTGDLNGDGAATITDMLMQKSAILGEELTANAMVAGDVNYDGAVTITDFLKVKSTLLGLSSLSAGRPQSADNTDALILLTPGSTQVWQSGGSVVSYYCDTPSVATIDKDGTITGIGVGSAFVYALDAQNNAMFRVMVSVLEEPLTVSLGASQQTMTPGQTLTLNPQFNHPVTSAITWSSSDESIVTVSQEGVLTAKAYGLATVTATIANGSTAQVSVRVTPALDSISFDRELYKVKPNNYRFPKLKISPADTDEEIIWTSSDPSIATVSADGTVYGVAYGDVTITATGKYSGLSASCKVSVCNVRQVAISFDDGPGGNTDWLLDYLKQKNIPVTFFLICEQIPRYPNTVKRQAAEGHEIGYHSYSHQNHLFLTSEQIISDFEKSNNMLKELTGQEFTLWRTPGGNYDQQVLDCVALPHILWSLDTLDWQSKDADVIYERIINNSFDGAIVLMHDIYGTTIAGAIRAMDALQDAGYEFLTVSEFLARDGVPAENCVNYFYEN